MSEEESKKVIEEVNLKYPHHFELELDNEGTYDLVEMKYYEKLQQQLEEQKKLNEEHQRINGKLREENKQLKDNWNKLKNYVKYNRKVSLGLTNGYGVSLCDTILDCIKELEKGDSNG